MYCQPLRGRLVAVLGLAGEEKVGVLQGEGEYLHLMSIRNELPRKPLVEGR